MNRDGVGALNGSFVDYGQVTTPQTHYMVYKTSFSPKEPAIIQKYYEDFANSFLSFLHRIGKDKTAISPLSIDAADGIGGLRVSDLNKGIGLNAKIVNSGAGEKIYLNELCGAEFVQKERKFPRNFDSISVHDKCACFDGDADRIVYL